MKKKIILILVASIALLASFELARSSRVRLTKILRDNFVMSSRNLSYGFYLSSNSSKGKFSLEIADSDYAPNETVLNALIGTLVKYNHLGRLEPYLAESFSVSKDGLLWSFKLKNGLQAQNNEEINAKNFVAHLLEQLKLYSKSGDPLDFALLKGWEDFKHSRTNTITGITVESNHIQFTFRSKPSDFLEILRMPYFGYWVSLKDNEINKFQSSSAFTVDVDKSTSEKLVLKKRNSWFQSSTADQLSFEYTSSESTIKQFDIVEIISPELPTVPNGFQIVRGPPTILNSLILSPYKGPFQKLQNRRAFLYKFRELQKNYPELSSSMFYITNANKSINLEKVEFSNDIKGSEVTLAYPSKHVVSNVYKSVNQILQDILEPLGVKVKIEAKEPLEDNWRQRLLSNKEFDVRYNGVDIGGHFLNIAIKMIFCSNLGVSFPDTSGRICRLVTEQDKVGGAIQNDYIEKFNKILNEDACVIPIKHYGISWFISDRIDFDTFPSTVVSPLFETIGFR